MGGRTVIELVLDPAVIPKGSKGELAEHGVRTGDIVRVGREAKGWGEEEGCGEFEGEGGGGGGDEGGGEGGVGCVGEGGEGG